MKKIKICVAMIVVVVAFLVLIIMASINAIDKIVIPETNITEPTITIAPITTDKANTTNYTPSTTNAQETHIITPEPLVTIQPTNTPGTTVNPDAPINDGSTMAEITISTDRKTRTFEIIADINEKTLKEYIGWLPSSALPGQEGMCVLMGHRDTNFSILKYAEYGDEFTVVMNGIEFTYIVSDIEIIDNDAEHRFNAMSGRHLVLITCYPFRYRGSALMKILFFARQN